MVDRERALGRGLRGAYGRSRQRREAVRLHQAPCEPEPLHAQRMLRAIVEAGPRVRIDQRGLHCSGVLEPGLDRGWPETGASRLRTAMFIAGRSASPAGWPETGASRLRTAMFIAGRSASPAGGPETGASRLRKAMSIAGRSASPAGWPETGADRKSTRLNSSHTVISYAVFCLKK